MGNIVITKERECSWDIAAYQDGHLVKKAWAMNRDQAYGKADILAEYYRDENGQRSGIIVNTNEEIIRVEPY